MNKQKRLTIGMGLFTFILFVAFGSIIFTEKAAVLMIPRIDKKIDSYLDKNYKELLNKVKLENTIYKNTVFEKKITDQRNNNHYFYIKYKDKKITDTYKEDYLEAKPFMKHLSNIIQKEIKKETNKDYKITMTDTFSNYTTMIQNKLLKEKNLKEVRCYTIEDTLTTSNWNKETIQKEITTYINELDKLKITPNNFVLTITNKDNTKKIKIDNITIETINKKEFSTIIDNILKDKKDDSITNNRIKYRYIK